jgi:hypothetical protein
MEKCRFREWLYGPKSHWPEEKKKKKDRIITPAPPVKCKCGVEASYGLVPSELGVGYFCGHMVDYDEVSSCCFFNSVRTTICVLTNYHLLFNIRALGNVTGSIGMGKETSTKPASKRKH